MIVWEFLTINFLGYNIPVSPVWISNSAWGNLNNRTSHQVTVGSNWSWMSSSKLPYLLDALWPIIATPNHFPVFWNEKDYEAGIVPFVVMLYLLDFVINGACVLCFYCIFLFLLVFTINLTDIINFNFHQL